METGVAIIIPTCDRPEGLNRAIASARMQTIPAQVVVVNDGKLPLTAIDGVTVVETPHPYSGPSVARNLGVKASSLTSRYICYLDDDDELLPEYVATQMSLLCGGKEFGFSTAMFRYTDGSETTDPEPSNKGPKRYYDPNALLHQNIAPVSSFVHTTSAWSKIGGWDETLLRMEDWDFWGRMFIACGPPEKSDKVTNVVHKGGSVSRSDHNMFAYAMSCHWRDIVEERLRYLSSNGSGMVMLDCPFQKVPPLTVVVSEHQAWDRIFGSGSKPCAETIIVQAPPPDAQRKWNDAFVSPRWFICPHDEMVKQLNFGVMMSRYKYVWIGENFDPGFVRELDHDVELYLVADGDRLCCRRALFERIGGLAEEMPLSEAIADLVLRSSKIVKARVIR